MKRPSSFSVLAASVVLAASGALADTTVLVNVNVIPMYTDTVLLQQTVIIVDGKIFEVGHVDAISIPKNAALIDGTVDVANFLDSNGGVIAKGKDADLVLLDSNPLENIKNSNRIHGVMLRGKWLPSSELDARLERYAIRDGK